MHILYVRESYIYIDGERAGEVILALFAGSFGSWTCAGYTDALFLTSFLFPSLPLSESVQIRADT